MSWVAGHVHRLASSYELLDKPPISGTDSDRGTEADMATRMAVRLAWRISHAFATGMLDLSARRNAPPVAWTSLPEHVMVPELRRRDESPAFTRKVTTFVADMDRARNATELWNRALDLHEGSRCVFEPD